MPQYREKQKLVSAIRWMGDIHAMRKFCMPFEVQKLPQGNGDTLLIQTVNGPLLVHQGHWIVKIPSYSRRFRELTDYEFRKEFEEVA